MDPQNGDKILKNMIAAIDNICGGKPVDFLRKIAPKLMRLKMFLTFLILIVRNSFKNHEKAEILNFFMGFKWISDDKY